MIGISQISARQVAAARVSLGASICSPQTREGVWAWAINWHRVEETETHLIRRTTFTGTLVAATIVVAAFAPATLAARPKTAPDEPPPVGLYCNRLPADLPVSYACIGEETIEVTGPTKALSPGRMTPMLNPGVIDKWTWARSAIIYLHINNTTVASVRETQRVTLNGRQSTSKMTLEDWNGGPIKGTLTQTCIKDNSWFADSVCKPSTSVIQSSYTLYTITNQTTFYHAADDLYWWKYQRKFYVRDHPNPSTADGVWYAPEGVNGYVASSNFNCDGDFPFTEVCRMN